MDFNYKETVSFTEKEKDTISNMMVLVEDISSYCESDDLRESVLKIRSSIEEFLQNYHEGEI